MARGSANVIEFPDLPPKGSPGGSGKGALLGPTLGTEFDMGQRLFAYFGSGDVFDYGEFSARDYKTMFSRNGTASALEMVLTLPIREADFSIEPGKGDSGECDFVRSVLLTPDTSGGMKTPMTTLIGQVTSAQIFRRAFFEKTFRVRDDGKIIYDKVAYRPPATCQARYNDRTGEANGFRQQVWLFGGNLMVSSQQKVPGYVDIPKMRSYIHTNGKYREPLTGTSELEVTYWALAHGSQVQTPDGPVAIEDIRRGDLVFGGNGEPTRVTAVHPRGKRLMYRVSFSDKTSVLCDAEHLWEVRERDTANRFKTRVLSTADMIARDVRLYDGYRYHVPLCGEAAYPERELPVDPYLLGAWIGDGTMLYRNGRWSKRAGERVEYGAQSPRLTTGDPFIAEEAARRSIPGVEVRKYAPILYGFTDTLRGAGNRMRDALVMLGLSCKSEERFIPAIYRQASPKQRWDLLRGLMDTDGHVLRGGRAVYTTSSPQLAADVQDLVQSLGGRARSRLVTNVGHGGNLHGHEIHRRRPLYRIEIVTTESPFLLPRKAERWEGGGTNERKSSTKAIVSIAPEDERECRCITVEADDGLFLTDNWTVTHNCHQTQMKLLFLLAAALVQLP
jgi:hypothetical protein